MVLERHYEDTQDIQMLADIKDNITKFNETSAQEIKHIHKHTTKQVYGEGEKPGSTLAFLFRRERGFELCG
mgnify:CR=1 FL=1